ncbi:RNA polymerase sigma factor [Hydrocarboniclastica marina]|uniref:RNA polymerase sigma factor n=1 Tax=Hydrocarboniclastica marina TaxID=2259620 RepID=A0A4P7XD94_9ALTE|nr:RNA polymerase sigma factor [Hydrocarboniclastica marina]QCF24849.1 RNA polymerase sigma factor [Hydrocarboniclastica marina]
MRIAETDLPLLEAAHGGDQASLAQLLQLCQPDVRRYAQRQCKITDIDDAVQEVLLIVARRLESLRVLAAFSSWLFKTVQRECRRLGRKALSFDPFEEEQLENWLGRFSNDELTVELARALEALPDHHREMILLRDFHGWTMAEIAGQLGVTKAAAKSRLHRAREAIRSLLMG